MRDKRQETLNLKKNLTTRQNWQALYMWLSRTQPGPATARLYTSYFKENEANSVEQFVVLISSTRKTDCEHANNLLLLMAKSSLYLASCYWTYGPNHNTGLPGGQKQTDKSLEKYSFSIFGVYSFYTVAAQRMAEWPSSWLCSWSRACDSRELSLARQRSLRDIGEGIFMPEQRLPVTSATVLS